MNRHRAHQNLVSIPQQTPSTRYHQSPTPQTAPIYQHHSQSIQEAFLNRNQSLNLSQNRSQNNNQDIPSPKSNSMINEDIQNNNSSTNSNANTIPNCNNSSKFVIQQTNINNKLLDNQKYQKYYSKRKILAQYEQEMRNQKRCRTLSGSLKEDSNRNYKTSIGSDENNSPKDLVTNIKTEPDNQNDCEDESDLSVHSNSEGISHSEGAKSIVEQSIS